MVDSPSVHGVASIGLSMDMAVVVAAWITGLAPEDSPSANAAANRSEAKVRHTIDLI